MPRSVLGVFVFVWGFCLLGACAIAQTSPSTATFDQGRVVTGERAVLDFRDRIAPENAMTRDLFLPSALAEGFPADPA
ncbi:MAG: hypothetical protein AAGK93_09080, partial [Pseudomonadota bacterium]